MVDLSRETQKFTWKSHISNAKSIANNVMKIPQKVIRECLQSGIRRIQVVDSDGGERSMVSVGRFTNTEYDAREDVVVQLMHCLFCATGRRIRYYNYYNIQILSDELQNVRDENFEMKMEIATLKAKNKLLSNKI
ncbi:hypothetical protein RYX36_032115 [Vicia faba]